MFLGCLRGAAREKNERSFFQGEREREKEKEGRGRKKRRKKRARLSLPRSAQLVLLQIFPRPSSNSQPSALSLHLSTPQAKGKMSSERIATESWECFKGAFRGPARVEFASFRKRKKEEFFFPRRFIRIKTTPLNPLSASFP